jgi:hypothetical protein
MFGNIVETKSLSLLLKTLEIYGDVGFSLPTTFGSDFIAPCTYYPSVTMILFIDGWSTSK